MPGLFCFVLGFVFARLMGGREVDVDPVERAVPAEWTSAPYRMPREGYERRVALRASRQ